MEVNVDPREVLSEMTASEIISEFNDIDELVTELRRRGLISDSEVLSPYNHLYQFKLSLGYRHPIELNEFKKIVCEWVDFNLTGSL